MAPVEGIEPPLTVLETVALPLYYTGTNLVVPEGIEPNCRHPAYYGNGFTVRRREQEP